MRVIASVLVATLAILGTSLMAARAEDTGPQGVVRRFCQADALGQRSHPQTWIGVAPLVDWPFEPAWDHAVLISDYVVGEPRPVAGGGVEVEVKYLVVGDVSAAGYAAVTRTEAVILPLQFTEQTGWRISGPPPTPHLFASRVDPEAIARSIAQTEGTLLANSSFVWQMYRAAGWNVAFQRTEDFPSGTAFRRVETPQPGDVVVYSRSDGTPYHVGILEAANQIVSSTLNAGVVRTSRAAFAGAVTYYRLVEPVRPEDLREIPIPQAGDAALGGAGPGPTDVLTVATPPAEESRHPLRRSRSQASPTRATTGKPASSSKKPRRKHQPKAAASVPSVPSAEQTPAY
jgi:hypothetical protein